jgi:hypothetical protein
MVGIFSGAPLYFLKSLHLNAGILSVNYLTVQKLSEKNNGVY